MDIPDLVRQALGDEEIQAGVSLGDEDAVCLTPTRTLVYKGDGLLSDEQVEEFSHDLDRIAVSEGHRKTKFTLEYFDGTRSFTVPPNRDEKVLQLLLEGVLRVESVISERESVVDVYRFSELTLIVTEGRIIKLIGTPVWHDDFEVYAYEDVTGLAFERASVATSVVIDVDGRPQRVKVPNDKAPIVRQAIEKSLFGYYDVTSLEELNRVVDDGSGGTSGSDDHDDIDFGSGIDPLVTDDEEELAEPEGTLEDISTGSAGESQADGTAAGGRAGDESTDAGETSAGAAADSGSEAVDSAPASGDSGAARDQGSSTDRNSTAGSNAATDSTATTDSDGTTGAASPTADPAQDDDSSVPDGEDAADDGGAATPAAETSESAGSAERRDGTTDSDGASGAGATDETAASPVSESGDGDATAGGASGDDAGASDASGGAAPATESDDGPDTTDGSATRDGDETGGSARRSEAGASPASTASDTATAVTEDVQSASQADVETVAERLGELTEAVDRQNELLKRQHRAIKQLVEQLEAE